MGHQWEAPFDPQASEPNPLNKILAVHLALLPFGPKGTLLYFSGNRWNPNNHDTGNVDYTALLDYQSRAFSKPGSPTGPDGLVPNGLIDVFCSGHSLLADGRLIVAGGTSIMGIPPNGNPHEGHWGGVRETFIFDPNATPPWQSAGLMNFSPIGGFTTKGGGRWYPSVVTLADGSVLAMCGHPRVYPPSYDEANPSTYPAQEDDIRHDNTSPDRYSPSSNSWAQLNSDSPYLGDCFLHDFAVYFPRVHVLPSGKLLFVQPLYTDGTYGDPSLDIAPSVLGDPPSQPWGLKSLVYDPGSETVDAYFTGPQHVDNAYLNSGYIAQYTSSVLLPLDPANGYRVNVLLTGGVNALIASFDAGAEATATWTATSPRPAFAFNSNSPVTVPPRSNGSATLLPTGDVFVSGGMNTYRDLAPGETHDEIYAVLVPELYSVSSGTWTPLTDAPATVPRGYHSSALLMLDGRVLTAGSEVNDSASFGAAVGAETRIELFEPDYITAPNRSSIAHNPPSVGYGDIFHVDYALAPGGASIARVAVMRYGSATHSFDYDQRYVILHFTDDGSGSLTVTAPPNGGVAPPGYYMLWLVDSAGLPCVQAGTLRIGYQSIYLEQNRQVFSINDVQLNQMGGQTTYRTAFYVVFDGFVANDVKNLTPNINFSQPGISWALSTSNGVNPALELPDSPQLLQRTVFAFDLIFQGVQAFSMMNPPDDLRDVTMTVTLGDYQCVGHIDLVMEPSPFMVDGDPFWLSADLRSFQVTPNNASQYLSGYNWVSPNDYITTLINFLNADATRGPALFTQLQPVQPVPLMQLPTVDGTPSGTPIFSFILARVHLDSNADAKNVRVMFRLFRTVTPSLTYDTSTIYQRVVSPIPGSVPATEDALPILGMDGTDLVSIPFFAAPRLAANQTDNPNLHDFTASPAETIRYYGCWLDINQPNVMIQVPGMALPASIQSLTTSPHQCVVAEVHYKYDMSSPDLPRIGDSPATSDKLAQRNLALTMTPNPGEAATRTVQHSFEIKATSDLPPASVVGQRAAKSTTTEGAESLVLWWSSIPRDAIAEIYLPGVMARDIIGLVSPGRAQTLEAIDDHTLRCIGLGDCTFIPLPPSAQRRALSGLITLRLPAGIRHKQVFKIVGQQFTRGQRVVGAFQIDIEVDRERKALMATLDKDQLAILKHQLQVIPTSDRWYPVLSRMAVQLGERVAAFGTDPDSVKPSPWGAGPHHPIDVGPPQVNAGPAQATGGFLEGCLSSWLVRGVLLTAILIALALALHLI